MSTPVTNNNIQTEIKIIPANEVKSVTAGNSAVPVGNAESQDSAQFGTAQQTSSANKSVSEQEIRNALKPILTKYGISNMSDIESVISGITNGLPRTQEELNSIVKCLQETLEAMREHGKPLDAENIIYFTKSVKIMTDNKWTIEGAIKDKFTNESQDTIKDKLVKFYDKFKGDYDFSNPKNREEIKQAVASYIKHYMGTNELQGITDVAKLLTNCKTDEERQFFEGVIKEIANTDERLSFLKSLIYSFDSNEARTQTANNLYGEMGEIVSGMSNDQAIEATNTVVTYTDDEGFNNGLTVTQEKAKAFYEENNIEELLKKPESELTPEETALLNKWKNEYEGVMSGSTIGLVNNENMSKNQKTRNLILLDNTIHEFGDDVYRSVHEQTYSYIEKHPEALNLPMDKFIELMDEVTNGNFTRIVNDSKNGTTTPLEPSKPVPPAEDPASKPSANDEQTGLFVLKEKGSEEKVEELKTVVEKSNDGLKQTTQKSWTKYGNSDLFLSAEATTTEDVDDWFNENGTNAAIGALNSQCKTPMAQYAYEKALDFYQTDKNNQKNILARVRKSSSYYELCWISTLSVVEEAQKRAKSFMAKQIAGNRIKELRDETCS